MAATGEKENGFWKRNSNIVLATCLRVKNQVWFVYFLLIEPHFDHTQAFVSILRFETDKHELVLGQILCLEATGGASTSPPVINKCHEMGGDQEWKHRKSVRIQDFLLYFQIN